MENNIKLNGNFTTNSYLKQFQIAQLNFSLVAQEEPLIRRKFRRRFNPLIKHDR